MTHLYEVAADIISRAKQKQGSVKGLCYSSNYRNKRKLFALVFESLRCQSLILKIIEFTKRLWENVDVPRDLLVVLIYEELFGRGELASSPHRDVIEARREELRDAQREVIEQFPELDNERKIVKVSLPRYARVNTIKSTLESAISQLTADGFSLVDKPAADLQKCEFLVDAHIKNVLVFAPGTDLHEHTLYRSGALILQDKASCLPAFILDPPCDSVVIDACAAPGNKSSHLAAIMQNKGAIYSFDLDGKRVQIMEKLLKRTGCSSVQAINRDFLKVRHDDRIYSKVEYILVDPSCSGSGMVDRMDDLVDGTIDSEVQSQRLVKLSGFQTAALSHALSFPRVKRVIYSTCSVHEEENEAVVLKAAKRFSDRFHLRTILPDWTNRGHEPATECIRASPDADLTNGFFVALFERTDTSSRELSGISSVENMNTESSLRDGSGRATNVPTKVKKRKRDKINTSTSQIDSSTLSNIFARKVTSKKKKRSDIKRPISC